jgi:hypothetical protein
VHTDTAEVRCPKLEKEVGKKDPDPEGQDEGIEFCSRADPL